MSSTETSSESDRGNLSDDQSDSDKENKMASEDCRGAEADLSSSRTSTAALFSDDDDLEMPVPKRPTSTRKKAPKKCESAGDVAAKRPASFSSYPGSSGSKSATKSSQLNVLLAKGTRR